MFRACPQRRNRLNNLHPNGVGKESRHCSFLASKRSLTQQPTPCYDERFPWGMSEASIVRWVLGICCLFLLFPEAMGSTPKFLGELQNVTVSMGREATFTCTVTRLGGHRVAWLKSDTKAILAIHDHVITAAKRMLITHNDKDTWTLTIKDVKPKDAGEYMCQINSVPMVTQVATLEVVVPPEISDKFSTNDISVSEGSQAKFFCSATGHPTPTITWRRDPAGRKSSSNSISGRHRKDGGHHKRRNIKNKIRRREESGRTTYEDVVIGESLVLEKVTREDMGKYMCIARNTVQPAASKIFDLSVNFKPQIMVPHKIIGTPVDSGIELKCRIEASPKPITVWSRKKVGMLVPSKKYQVEEIKLNPYKYESILRMSSLEAGDFDEYRCVSENTIGKSEAVINVYKIEPEVEIKSTESYHIQKTYDEKDNNNADSSSQNQFGKFRNEYDTTQNEKDTNNDPFRKNKSTVYGTPKNQRRNTKDNKNGGYMTQNEKMRNRKERNGFAGNHASRIMTNYLVKNIVTMFVPFLLISLIISSNPFTPYPSTITMKINHLYK